MDMGVITVGVVSGLTWLGMGGSVCGCSGHGLWILALSWIVGQSSIVYTAFTTAATPNIPLYSTKVYSRSSTHTVKVMKQKIQIQRL